MTTSRRPSVRAILNQPAPAAATVPQQEERAAESVHETPGSEKKQFTRTLKQIAFAIGKEREQRLDELAFEYNRRKGTRIGRNDIARYLIDTLSLDDLLPVDLTEYKK